MLFPEQRAVEVSQPGTEPQRLEAAELLDDGEVLPGLRLDLERIWAV